MSIQAAFLTTHDPLDIFAWSGTPYYMVESLRKNDFTIECVGNLLHSRGMLTRLTYLFYSKIRHSQYFTDRVPRAVKFLSFQAESQLAHIKHNLIFSPGTLPVAYLKSNKPIVIWTDATFAGMVNYYSEFKNLCRKTIKHGNIIEQRALTNCHLAIFASEWAANSALENYKLDQSKVKVVPFGANIECNRTVNDIEKTASGKNFDKCRLLFIGVDWIRKGADFAVSVAQELIKRGVETELHIVGCNPPAPTSSFVINHGFISKKSEIGRRKFQELMTTSHFLLVPSQAECFGLVYAEASSFGLPSLATKTGGITSVIKDGKNGFTFHIGAAPALYCDYIVNLLNDKKQYHDISKSSFLEYSQNLNWHSAGNKVSALIKEHCF